MPASIVVVIDDDHRVRDSIQSVLESAGYNAIVFASAEECLHSGQIADAICIVADVRLPGIDGLDLQRRVRRARPDCPVIFVTAHDDEDVRQRALENGAIAFLVKPFDVGELLEKIAQTSA